MPEGISLAQVDIWFQDEARVGQQGSRTRVWAPKGTRPRVVKQQQFLCQYIFGAVCSSQKSCAAIVVPCANHQALEKRLEEISFHIPSGRHAVVVMDRAGWHTKSSLKVPPNISILYLPPYSPELNPQENVWQHLKDTYLANRVFASSKQIVDSCCKAWEAFAASPGLIASISQRSWSKLT